MKKLLGITLGIMTALGGFVDLGQIVFTMQAGALFGYKLVWVILLGTVAIILYMEMCGRVAVVAREPVFSTVRNRLGFRIGLVTLIASNLLNLLTCAAELAGIAIVLHLLTGWPEKLLLVLTAAAFTAIIALLKFEVIERVFGLSGLLMILFAVSAVSSHPDWHLVAKGILPTLPTTNKKDLLLYAYFVVGIFSALLMEYEVHFYSSGAIEEGWKTKDLGENFMVAALGSLLGSLLTIALLILGAIVFVPRQIFPETLSSTVLAGALPFGPMALRLLLGGVLAALGGAVVETALSGSYNLCQFFNFTWGKDMRARQTPVYTSAWVAMLALGLLIAITGIRPLQLVNISVIFGMVIMPFTYYPILLTAADRKVMGKHANKRIVSYVAGFFFVLIVIAALAAVPLSIVTNWGRP